MTTRLIVAACVVAGLSGVALPESAPGASIRERGSIQRGNISEGVDEGDLTRREATRLRDRQQNVQEERREAKRDDGHIDPRERDQLRTKQNRLGNAIYDQRNDRQTR